MIQATVELKDSYTSTCTKVISSANQLDKALESNSNTYMKMNNKVSSVMSSIKSKFKSAWNATKKPFKWTADTKIFKTLSRITNAVGKVTTKLAKLSAKAFTVSLKPAGMLAKGGMKAMGVIGNLAKWGAAGLTAAGGGLMGMAKMGSDLEQQKISMTHFLGGDQVKSDAYLKELRANANATPFETGEVVQAGTRAIQIAEGDTAKGMEFVKLAEDMAALNPGKTISDAMEALADANMGEMERLKEFGFKGSKKEFDKSKGDLFKMKSSNGKTLQEMYAGGAGKLAGSSKGKLSTFTGKVKSGLQDAGLKVLEKLAPVLDRLIPLADVLGEKIGFITDGALAYFEKFFAGFSGLGDELFPILKSVFDSIKPIFNDIVTNIGPALKGAFNLLKPVLEKIAPVLTAVWDALKVLVQPLITLGETLMPIFAEALGFLSPIITGIVKPAFEIIGMYITNYICPVLTALWKVISTVLNPVINIVSKAFEGIKPVVDSVTKIMGGLVGAIGGAIEAITGLIGKAWKGVKGAGKWVWNKLSDAGSWVSNKLSGNATGTDYFGGGLTRINERGEELINLPRGSKIYPSGKTNQIMNREIRGKNNNSNIYNLTINVSTGGDISEEKLGQILLKKFREFAPQGV